MEVETDPGDGRGYGWIWVVDGIGWVGVGVEWVGDGGEQLGVIVTGYCFHVLHLKSAHRQTANNITYNKIGPLAAQANEPESLKGRVSRYISAMDPSFVVLLALLFVVFLVRIPN